MLSVYLAGLIADDNNFDFGTFKAVGVFYIMPVLILYALLPEASHEHLRRRQQRLMRILLDNFSKSFGTTKVIENMNLEVGHGEMLALLGPSGCGKSTTLFAICGIHRPTGGRILFGDRDVTDLPSQERNVGVVFQSYALYPHMTVAENIGFPLKVKGCVRSRNPQGGRRASPALVHIGNLLGRAAGASFPAASSSAWRLPAR